jgi:Activator of Hsp90 ATPase homolog 1-like protein
MVDAHLDDPPVLKITRLLNATRQEVFAAWTDPASVKQWLCPEAVAVARVELDVRVGGAFRIDMQDQVELFARGDQTELVLTQVQLPDEEARQRHAVGWRAIMAHLATYMENKLKP